MLDWFFTRKMNLTGRRNYLIGTLIFAVVFAFIFIFFAESSSSGGTDTIFILLLVIPFVVFWGSYCSKRWPITSTICPWCREENHTPDLEEFYVCDACKKEFFLKKTGHVKKA